MVLFVQIPWLYLHMPYKAVLRPYRIRIRTVEGLDLPEYGTSTVRNPAVWGRTLYGRIRIRYGAETYKLGQSLRYKPWLASSDLVSLQQQEFIYNEISLSRSHACQLLLLHYILPEPALIPYLMGFNSWAT